MLELSREDFRFDTTYPDVRRNRIADFVLVDIVLSANASRKAAPKGPGPLFFLAFLETADSGGFPAVLASHPNPRLSSDWRNAA